MGVSSLVQDGTKVTFPLRRLITKYCLGRHAAPLHVTLACYGELEIVGVIIVR